MTFLLTLLGWVLFLLGIGASIALHEIGHLVPAKRFGVKVTQYMVGFGPTIWSRKGRETEYGVKAIPLGGYIRMIGMYPPKRNADGSPGDPTQLRMSSTGRIGAMIDDARRTSLEEIQPADLDRVFYKLPVRQKLVVMLGGPVMNLAIATVLFTVLLVAYGLPGRTPTASAVSQCVPSQAQVEAAIAGTLVECPPGADPSPALAAGLAVGDTVTSFGGMTVTTWDDLSALIKASPPGPVVIGVTREDGTTDELTATLIESPRPVTLEDGTTAIAPGTFLGMSPSYEVVPQSVTAVPGYMWGITTKSVYAIATLPVRLWELGQSTFGSAERDPEGLVGVVGVGRISGEVTATRQLSTTDKAFTLLSLLAGLNLFLFLFNLIPLLPLDGGHIAGALWEGLRRQWARVRGRPDPGPVDVAKALPIAYGVAFALIAMSALLIYADVVEPIRLGI